jgi:dTDP-4-amino-4,6-dideoxygalactose transaminase
VATQYLVGLKGLDRLTLPASIPDVRHAYHLFVIRTAQRDELAVHLSADGIQTGIHYPIALPKLRAYEYLGQSREATRANRLDGEVLSLPMGEHITLRDVDRVCDSIRRWHSA